jgi:hypothetical protein
MLLWIRIKIGSEFCIAWIRIYREASIPDQKLFFEVTSTGTGTVLDLVQGARPKIIVPDP